MIPFLGDDLEGDSSPSLEAQPNDLSSIREDKCMPIAVIGMSFRGPGDATNVENLWKVITEARESWSEVPKER
jgi:Beta-ketoacyl synthase, N-terminal domain